MINQLLLRCTPKRIDVRWPHGSCVRREMPAQLSYRWRSSERIAQKPTA
jgi:hypothetical protein